jgi:cellulose synthase/poly-beta-1,6-N-acetylglucosamine synthase-like glycosyltransferase
MVALFWISLFLVVYTYALYPLLLFGAYALAQAGRDGRYLLTRRDRRKRGLDASRLPRVSLVVPAHNEEAHLEAKLGSIRAFDYPSDRLEVVFVSDGSTDGTNAILEATRDPGIQTILLPDRGGKARALNRGVQASHGEILVLTDASTLFAPSAVRRLARHFEDPRVGVACGRLSFEAGEESRKTEGVYWSYESLLRAMEGRLGATLTASGAIYAVRREAFRELPPDVILDDFVVPMTARGLGYRVVYDPEAVATDFAAASVAAEYDRRVRLALGSYRALARFARVPLDPVTLWAFISHKLLRWLLPFLMLTLLLSSGALARIPLYGMAFVAQLVFYLWAFAGFLLREHTHSRAALVPYYLTAIHLAFLVGFVRYLKGGADGTW